MGEASEEELAEWRVRVKGWQDRKEVNAIQHYREFDSRTNKERPYKIFKNHPYWEKYHEVLKDAADLACASQIAGEEHKIWSHKFHQNKRIIDKFYKSRMWDENTLELSEEGV